MKTAICCIAKCENNYLKEWADYHLALGFSHIFIYDNNNVDGERIEPLFNGYDDVSILDCRGEKAYQNKAYTSFYKQYGHLYDWIAFIDVDEFITFSKESGLHAIDEFLGRFDSKVEIVHLNWMCFGDNGIVELDDNYSVLDRFKEPLDYDKKVQYDFPENNHVKSIIRGGIDIGNTMITVHTPKDRPYVVVDAGGHPCDNDYFKSYDFSTAFIRHYVTKTICEWLMKIAKGNVVANAFSELYPIDRFFLYNERTTEKEKVIRQYLMFKETFEQSVATDLAIYQSRELELQGKIELLSAKYQAILDSKAYRVGKKLMKFFKK
jgi:hypothetical protein